MSKAELLHEIADVMDDRPFDGYKSFEFYGWASDEFIVPTSWESLLGAAMSSAEVRKRIRTTQVSGVVTEEALKAAKGVASRAGSCTDAYVSARALLDLIEQSEQ